MSEYMTLAEHAEAWWQEQGKIVPAKDTFEWRKMYAEWVAFAFGTTPKHGRFKRLEAIVKEAERQSLLILSGKQGYRGFTSYERALIAAHITAEAMNRTDRETIHEALTFGVSNGDFGQVDADRTERFLYG